MWILYINKKLWTSDMRLWSCWGEQKTTLATTIHVVNRRECKKYINMYKIALIRIKWAQNDFSCSTIVVGAVQIRKWAPMAWWMDECIWFMCFYKIPQIGAKKFFIIRFPPPEQLANNFLPSSPQHHDSPCPNFTKLFSLAPQFCLSHFFPGEFAFS